jgi:hypothetical protein
VLDGAGNLVVLANILRERAAMHADESWDANGKPPLDEHATNGVEDGY